MAVEQVIRGIYVGEDKDLIFDLEQDTTGWTVTFTMATPSPPGPANKTTEDGSIATEASESGPTNGLSVELLAADTTVDPGSYAFELRRTDPGSVSVLAFGNIVLASATLSGFYSSPDAVIARTGVEPGDLGLPSEESLGAYLGGLLREITETMDRKMRTSYLGAAGGVPAGVDGIAADAAANAVRNALVTRQSPTVRIDDFTIRTVAAPLLTADVLERLALYTITAANHEVSSGELDAAWGGGSVLAALEEDVG